MFTRQRTLLFLLKAAARPVERMELTKWCFLLRHESATGGGSAFYDFVPYRFGPFSFGLYQEAAKLGQSGYLFAPDEDCWAIRPGAKVPLPPKEVETDVHRLLRRFQATSLDALLDYVYEKYPAYTVNNEKRKLAAAPRPSPPCLPPGTKA